jgi:hypothetical protein
MKRLLFFFLAIVLVFALAGFLLFPNWIEKLSNLLGRMGPRDTMEQRLKQYGKNARLRMVPYFRSASVPYPPRAMTWMAIKKERVLEVYAGSDKKGLKFVHRYPIRGASGFLGPKLREGDRQVPEGIYRISFLNPNSKFHLSLRLDYPNAFDRMKAGADGRTNLGGDIMIHGDSVSTGCLAMGNTAIEELFVMAAETGLPTIRVVIVPIDFRKQKQLPAGRSVSPPWVNELYARLIPEAARLPLK